MLCADRFFALQRFRKDFSGRGLTFFRCGGIIESEIRKGAMSEITRISPQKGDKTRCNIETDGRFCCGMKLETVVRNRLHVGSVVTREELVRLQLESEKATAFDKALSHISASMKTEREIRSFLVRKGYLEEVCDDVVEKMKANGFLDDGAYAAAYCESAGKRKGRRLIEAELRRRGVPDDEIADAIGQLSGEEEGLRRALEKYLKNKPNDRKTFAKAYAYLLSRGYESDMVRAALSECGAEEET